MEARTLRSHNSLTIISKAHEVFQLMSSDTKSTSGFRVVYRNIKPNDIVWESLSAGQNDNGLVGI